MKNRLLGYICIFILFEVITQSPIYAKVINDTCRAKREIAAISQPRDTAKKTAKQLEEVSLKRERNDDALLEDGDAHLNEKHRISRRFANSVNTDSKSSIEKSTDYEAAAGYRVRRLNEESDYAEEAEEETNKEEIGRQDQKTASNLVRLSRDVNDKYTDQDERSSLYDDYEAKDVAKRGILGGPEDYEEAEDDSSKIEDVAALQEQELASNEADKRETRNDARVKRDQTVAGLLVDKSDSTPDNAPKLDELKIAEEDPTSSRRVSLVESTKSFDGASDDISSKTKDFESNVIENPRSNEASLEIKEPTGVIAPSSANDDLNAEYEKRVEDEIQRKIDFIKEEIRRDIEAQERIRDIEANNAKFDELRKHEDEEEERNVEGEPIEKRQIVAKRSVRKEDVRKNNDKRSAKEQRNKLHRSREIDKSNASNENRSANRQSGQLPANRLVKKKRERDREMFLLNNERESRKRRSRSYTSDRTGVTPKNELFADRDLNSRLHTDDKALPNSDPSENEREENRVSSGDETSLVSLTGSSQELSPRLAREYKEAFGGLQSESGGALARYKRVKRVLSDSDAKI
ncbi:intracellular protein transport protein USO1-like [Pseudomyrmex gracilis]|uniref:intracellular protein transport protein USO1-like n=1 Tax=Pseudomyrmex gracilis TaxID=219809 RepID=UPI0009950796|nr:intracellular protein transport protein USO1-like [Pseudomyrmex gracilis]